MKQKQLAKLIIYNAGFLNGEESLSMTADLVCKKDPKKNHRPTLNGEIFFLNMNDFIVLEDNTMGFKNQESEAVINSLLDTILKLLKDNPKKNLHVVTRLCGVNQVDATPLQQKRLIYILDYLKLRHKMFNPIILIGHSQGGLVNIDVAMNRHFMIERLISISTPYNTATLGQEFLSLVHPRVVLAFFKLMVKEIENPEDYVTSFVYLGGKEHYIERKKRWEEIKGIRPPLHMLCGISGKKESYWAALFPSDIKTTDGLVTYDEQVNFDGDTLDFFVDQNLACVVDGSNQYQIGCLNCKRNCHFSLYSVRNLLVELGLNVVLNRDEINNLLTMANHVLQQEENTEGYYDSLYRIFANAFSHSNMRYNEHTIEKIIEYINLEKK